ncbi:helix-turn-helix domain-containing protein [Tardiphaga sp. 768_D3_N2_1]|uniref:helix-turn-helix domain-containing protein n=1 Tax=Tardiphaga sp. 768_D3_N2_1 TaxID=3240783 RepID=UPI003F898983
MSKLLGAALRQARQWKKLTQGNVAKHLGVSRAAVGQWEAGDNAPSSLKLIKLCAFLGIEVSAALDGIAQVDMFAGIRSEPSPIDKATFEAMLTSMMEKDKGNIDIYKSTPEGTADFRLYPEIVGSVARPPGLTKVYGVSAIYAVGSSMTPKFNEGDLIFLTESRTPSLNDYVLIRLFPDEEEGWADCYVRQLMGRDDRNITVRQHNPDKVSKLDITKIESIDRIFPWNEIITG